MAKRRASLSYQRAAEESCISSRCYDHAEPGGSGPALIAKLTRPLIRLGKKIGEERVAILVADASPGHYKLMCDRKFMLAEYLHVDRVQVQDSIGGSPHCRSSAVGRRDCEFFAGETTSPSGNSIRRNIMADQKQYEKVFVEIDKAYGEGSIMWLGQASHLAVKSIPTGSLALDLGHGRWRRPTRAHHRDVRNRIVWEIHPLPAHHRRGATTGLALRLHRRGART